jgi:hypothetical protein
MSDETRPPHARDCVPDFPMMTPEKAADLSDGIDALLGLRVMPWDSPEEAARKMRALCGPDTRVELRDWAASVGHPVRVRWLHDANGGRPVAAATLEGWMRASLEPYEELGFSEDEAIQRLAESIGGRWHRWQDAPRPDGTVPTREELLPMFQHTSAPAK